MQQLLLFETPKPAPSLNKYDDYAWHWTWNSSQHQLKLSIGQRCLADRFYVLNPPVENFEQYEAQKWTDAGLEVIGRIECDTKRGKTWFEVEILDVRKEAPYSEPDRLIYTNIIARVTDSYDGSMIGEVICTKFQFIWVHKPLIPPLPSC